MILQNTLKQVMQEEGLGGYFYGSPYMRCLGKIGSSEVGVGNRGENEQRVGVGRRSICVGETEEVPLEREGQR